MRRLHDRRRRLCWIIEPAHPCSAAAWATGTCTAISTFPVFLAGGLGGSGSYRATISGTRINTPMSNLLVALLDKIGLPIIEDRRQPPGRLNRILLSLT